jgi:hypothetical protein
MVGCVYFVLWTSSQIIHDMRQVQFIIALPEALIVAQSACLSMFLVIHITSVLNVTTFQICIYLVFSEIVRAVVYDALFDLVLDTTAGNGSRECIGIVDK